MLCVLCVAFSARHRARSSGRGKFISAGASVPGVSWKTMRTPSSVSSWPVRMMSWVGGTRLTVPFEVVMPRPALICPSADFGSRSPYMKIARRVMALPA